MLIRRVLTAPGLVCQQKSHGCGVGGGRWGVGEATPVSNGKGAMDVTMQVLARDCTI